jgi:23S rRNA pseudouridine955/2504/2580 synthase
MIIGTMRGEVKLKGIDLLFENDDCIILNKPAGLAVQGGARVGVSLDELLAENWSPRPLLVHRLDKDTSGLLLAAKNREAAARFSALFAGNETGGKTGRGIRKSYLAVCAGRPEPGAGRVRLDLWVRGELRNSETRYRLLSGTEEFSLLELELGTGRTHQIRRHLAGIGHPILGDDKYGNFALNRELRRTRGLRRLLLHASRLTIDDESIGFPLDITAPPPEYFTAFLNDVVKMTIVK